MGGGGGKILALYLQRLVVKHNAPKMLMLQRLDESVSCLPAFKFLQVIVEGRKHQAEYNDLTVLNAGISMSCPSKARERRCC